MPVEVKRKSNETIFSLLSRFKDKVKKGRVLKLAKKNMHRQKPLSKLQTKRQSLQRKRNQERREYLIRTGKIKENIDVRIDGKFERSSGIQH